MTWPDYSMGGLAGKSKSSNPLSGLLGGLLGGNK